MYNHDKSFTPLKASEIGILFLWCLPNLFMLRHPSRRLPSSLLRVKSVHVQCRYKLGHQLRLPSDPKKTHPQAQAKELISQISLQLRATMIKCLNHPNTDYGAHSATM